MTYIFSFVQSIIKQLFKVEVSVISGSLRLRLMNSTSTLITLAEWISQKKTSCNNFLLIVFAI